MMPRCTTVTTQRSLNRTPLDTVETLQLSATCPACGRAPPLRNGRRNQSGCPRVGTR